MVLEHIAELTIYQKKTKIYLMMIHGAILTNYSIDSYSNEKHILIIIRYETTSGFRSVTQDMNRYI
uniref:Uncharacterized protein n=1 Tax=Lepeophtheirus salmonis TaxID=72036 RepID=A0A0K2UES3_LEPSM